jgi:LysM domain-containing protein
MPITHEEAHKLIQFSMDRVLEPQEKNILQVHLNDCVECRTFADEIKELEKLLLPVMIKQWAAQPVPLLIASIANKRKRNSQIQTSLILATRTAMISIVFAAFVFSAWQFTHSNSQTFNPRAVSVLPIPTPSGQSTSTKISFQNCEEAIYKVQENDTLESIASQFSVAKDKIVAINKLGRRAIHPKMELLIPICTSTPTGTLNPSTLTTFTPLMGPTTSTPGGS